MGEPVAKFRTGKFRPGIAFTICTNQFHFLAESDHEVPKLVSKMEHELSVCLEYSVRINRTTYSSQI